MQNWFGDLDWTNTPYGGTMGRHGKPSYTHVLTLIIHKTDTYVKCIVSPGHTEQCYTRYLYILERKIKIFSIFRSLLTT